MVKSLPNDQSNTFWFLVNPSLHNSELGVEGELVRLSPGFNIVEAMNDFFNSSNEFEEMGLIFSCERIK
jgi:hypothetical protein